MFPNSFIFYKTKSFLWDPKRKDHYKKKLREDAWREVSPAMNIIYGPMQGDGEFIGFLPAWEKVQSSKSVQEKLNNWYCRRKYYLNTYCSLKTLWETENSVFLLSEVGCCVKSMAFKLIMEICNQESDIINKCDLEHIMADLSQDNQNFTVFLEEEEYVDINQMCDSTQEMKHETSDGVNNQNNDFNVICLPCTLNTDIRSSTGTHPSIVEYAGPYNFEISLANCMTYRRGSWVYSMKLKKVFIDVDKVMLVKFKLSGNCPLGLRVRALLVYTVPDHITRAVSRCTLHKFNCDPNQIAHSSRDVCLCQHYNFVGHVLTTDHANAIYEYNSESERHSVVVPLGLPQPGSDTVTVAYQFGCKTSCPGGMSRRPVSIIFTLETPAGEVLGRRTVAVKVCSCPKRDKEREESEFEKNYMAVTNIRGRRKRLTANDVKMPIASTSFGSLKRLKTEQQIECEGSEKLCSTQTNYLVQNLNVIIDQLQGALQGLQNIRNVLSSSN